MVEGVGDPVWGRLSSPPPGTAPVSGECQLWPVPVRPRPEWLDLLTENERDQVARIRVSHARDVFVTSRAAQRLIGEHYLKRPPRDVAIVRTCLHCGADHGRPRFAEATIDYAVSHTRQWVAVAVVGHGMVGVDLESVLDPHAAGLSASHVLSAREEVRLVDEPDRAARLLRVWTRKEAAVKLTGHGLLADFRTLDVTGPVVVATATPEGWPRDPIHLLDVPVAGDLRVALATTVAVRTLVRCRPAFA